MGRRTINRLGYGELAAEPAVLAHIVGDCEHVAFFFARTPGKIAVHEHMAGREGAIAATITVDAGYAVIDRGRHQCVTGPGIHFVFGAVKFHVDNCHHAQRPASVTFNPDRQA
jgi:hypothetical protein